MLGEALAAMLVGTVVLWLVLQPRWHDHRVRADPLDGVVLLPGVGPVFFLQRAYAQQANCAHLPDDIMTKAHAEAGPADTCTESAAWWAHRPESRIEHPSGLKLRVPGHPWPQ